MIFVMSPVSTEEIYEKICMCFFPFVYCLFIHKHVFIFQFGLKDRILILPFLETDVTRITSASDIDTGTV